MAVRYDADRAPFRFSPSVLPAPPPAAARARAREGSSLCRPSSSTTAGAPPAILSRSSLRLPPVLRRPSPPRGVIAAIDPLLIS